MKEIKKLYYKFMFIIILLFLSIQIYFYLSPTPTIEESNKEIYNKIKSREIKSVFKRKGIDYDNRRASYVVYGNDSIPFILDWEKRVKVGDSIIKPKGSLKLIIKDTIGIVDTLDYEENEWIILTDNF